VHLLLGEPKRGNPSVVMRALADSRQETLWDAALEFGHIWQRRFYDFVVFSEKKRVEKIRYMHRNPVVRGLVLEPEEWAWSSFRHYAYRERGTVMVNEMERSELRVRKIS
jgi:putative transposase